MRERGEKNAKKVGVEEEDLQEDRQAEGDALKEVVVEVQLLQVGHLAEGVKLDFW